MRIKIDEVYYVQLDTNGNYTLYFTQPYKTGKNIGEDSAVIVGYYSSLPSALNRYVKHKLSDKGETVSIEEYLTRYNEIVENLIKNTLPKEVK